MEQEAHSWAQAEEFRVQKNCTFEIVSSTTTINLISCHFSNTILHRSHYVPGYQKLPWSHWSLIILIRSIQMCFLSKYICLLLTDFSLSLIPISMVSRRIRHKPENLNCDRSRLTL